MSKASLKLKPIGYPVYHAIAQLNPSFEDCIENLNHVMSFNLLDPDMLRTSEAMVEEVRALVNQNFGDFINVAELENGTYYQGLRLKWQTELDRDKEKPAMQELERMLTRQKRLSRRSESQHGKKVQR
jgi:hypothetical protein